MDRVGAARERRRHGGARRARSWRRRDRARGGLARAATTALAATALGATGLAGCSQGPGAPARAEADARPTGRTSGPSAEQAYATFPITTDGTNRFLTAIEGRRLVVEAPKGNTGGNLRLALVRRGTPVARDQTSCTTWHGPNVHNVQPGLVLQARSQGGRAQAITITDNIWYGARWTFNVHLADSAAAEPMRLVGSLDLSRALGTSMLDLAPFPWRLCARIRGTEVTAKVWSLADRTTEPAWDDPRHTATLSVPSRAVHRGRPGIYVAHLSPGDATSFSDPATR